MKTWHIVLRQYRAHVDSKVYLEIALKVLGTTAESAMAKIPNEVEAIFGVLFRDNFSLFEILRIEALE